MATLPKRAERRERKLIALHAPTAARAVIGADASAHHMVAQCPGRDPEKLSSVFG